MRKILGTFIIVIALLVSGATSSMAASSTYTVKKGDSLSKIANMHNVSVSNLKSMNNLKSNMIYPKQKLKVTGSAKATSTKQVSTKAVATNTYKVKKGDSLSKIAKMYNTSVSNLKSLNGLKSNLIRVNQTLKVTGTVKATSTKQVSTKAVATNTYKVKQGDSLSKIAKAHNTSVSNLKSLNGLKSNLIRVNQTLKVTGTAKVTSTVKTSTPSRSNTSNVAREFYVSATAYTANCTGCSGITKTGINLKQNPNLKVIAVDPNVIKLGSKVHVEGYGYAVAGDTGGAIKGNKIDVFFPSKSTAYEWGRKQVKIKVLD